jgi:SAM-dependent methyltransferase
VADGPLKRLLASIVARGFVYDALQRAAGTERFNAHIEESLRPIARGCVVIDAGGGTGMSRQIWPEDCDYVNVDNDPEKLEAFARKKLPGKAVLGDITALDKGPGSVDYVFTKAVTHHLDDGSLDGFLKDSARVLKPDGKLVFFDAVYSSDRFVSRLFWRYDRGSFPRERDVLVGALNRYFSASLSETVVGPFHTYVFYVGTPRAAAA